MRPHWAGRRDALAILATTTLLTACRRLAPEARLQARIFAMRDAVRARQADVFMTAVANDFVGTDGITRNELGTLVQTQLAQSPYINLTLGLLDIRRRGASAEVAFNALLSGVGRIALEDVHGWRVRTYWHDGADDWLLVRAHWRSVP